MNVLMDSFANAGVKNYDQLDHELPLKDQGIDSISMMAIAFEIEKITNERLPDEMLNSSITIKQIKSFLASKNKT